MKNEGTDTNICTQTLWRIGSILMYNVHLKQNWTTLKFFDIFQLQSDWAQVQVIELRNDGAGFGFGISGSRNSGAVVRNIFPGGAADRVSKEHL